VFFLNELEVPMVFGDGLTNKLIKGSRRDAAMTSYRMLAWIIALSLTWSMPARAGTVTTIGGTKVK
jgi:hypothetical protein